MTCYLCASPTCLGECEPRVLTTQTSRNKVRQKWEVLQQKRNNLAMKLRLLQNEVCSHPVVEKEHRVDTGNYDTNSDHYYTKFHCPDCDKHWTEEGTK